MAIEAAEALSARELRFLPCRQPVHRAPTRASAKDRLAMLQLAIQGEPCFRVDRREIERATPSYMIETLTSLRLENPDESITLILGMDAFATLPTWQAWQKIPEWAHLLVLRRAHSPVHITEPLQALLYQRQVDRPAALAATTAGKICYLQTTPLDISSSAVRALLTEGRSARFLLPDSVLDYIQAQQLY